jgi:hypothetical protein
VREVGLPLARWHSSSKGKQPTCRHGAGGLHPGTIDLQLVCVLQGGGCHVFLHIRTTWDAQAAQAEFPVTVWGGTQARVLFSPATLDHSSG